MSRFIDELKRVSQVVPQPMGFRRMQPVSRRPKMLLVASLAQIDADNLAGYVAGADAGLLPVSELSLGAKTLHELSHAMPDIPWGGRLVGGGQEGIEQMVKAGCDFVVFPAADTPLAVFQNDEVGKILEVEPSLGEGLVRAVNRLSVDAVLITAREEKKYLLTWHHLMLFQCFADLLTKPLLVSIPLSVTADELQSLWEAGVDGVVVEVKDRRAAGKLKKLRQTIDKLAFPSPRRWKKVEALLSHIEGETDIVAEEEE